MTTDTNNKYHDLYIREHPDSPEAEALADMLAEQEIKRFIEDRLKNQKNFTKRVFRKLSSKMLETYNEPEGQGGREVDHDNEPSEPRGDSLL
jgi:hypothetical protein